MRKLKLAVLISGRGSNMAALVNAAEAVDFPAEIVLVLSNRGDAAGLAFATQRGIPTAILDHRSFADRQAFEQAMDETIRARGVDVVCLAGFMRLLTPWFVERWIDRLINIHPSLLPAFRGLHTHERAIQAGVKFTGCTVHFVRPEMDTGPIILQAAVPVAPDDDALTLAARVLDAEHQCYPLAIRLIAQGEIAIEGDRVTVKGATTPRTPLLNPGEQTSPSRVLEVKKPDNDKNGDGNG